MCVKNRTSRVGIFGGTFDPVHIGHLVLCQEAKHQLGLQRILLLPAADPPHKQGRKITPVERRIEMLSLVTAGSSYLEISRIDVDRPGPHFSVDTIRLLQLELGAKRDLYFLMGLDSLRNLPTWHRPEWLLNNCRIVTFHRADIELDWNQLENALPGVRRKVAVIDMPKLEISSSDIRTRTYTGEPIRYLVPDAVLEYIRINQLYRPNEVKSNSERDP